METNSIMLNNGHGLNIYIYKIAREFAKAAEKKIKSRKKNFRLRLTERDCPQLKSLIKSNLANHINIKVNVYFKNKANSTGHFYYKRKNKIFDIKKNILKSVKIRGDFFVGTDNFITSLYGLLSHELTHSYDELCRKKNNAKTLWDKGMEDGLANINDTTYCDYYQVILKDLLQQTTTIERNAYVAHIISDIQEYLLYCYSSDQAWNCINNKSMAWRNRILPIDNYIPWFKNLTNIDKQNWCIKYYNHVTNKNITTYDAFLKHILYRWEKYKKKLIVQLDKQITDTSFKNPQWQSLSLAC